jgi:hypothetical protein
MHELKRAPALKFFNVSSAAVAIKPAADLVAGN